MQVANEILIPEMARLLQAGKLVRFTPSGVSMRPFIEGGKDSVVLTSVSGEPQRGDILLARVQTADNQQVYVLHRLVRIEGSGQRANYILQGDGNLFGEEMCCREDIIGKVVRIETADGKKKWLSNGRVWYWLRSVRKWLLKIYRHTMI